MMMMDHHWFLSSSTRSCRSSVTFALLPTPVAFDPFERKRSPFRTQRNLRSNPKRSSYSFGKCPPMHDEPPCPTSHPLRVMSIFERLRARLSLPAEESSVFKRSSSSPTVRLGCVGSPSARVASGRTLPRGTHTALVRRATCTRVRVSLPSFVVA